MSKTLSLRKIITAQLSTVAARTYYRQAPAGAQMPYVVFDLSRVDLGDLSRDDFELAIDYWDKASDTKSIDEAADRLDALLNCANLPASDVLPTFFRSNRYPIPEADKDLQHLRQIFEIQLYTREE